MSSLPGHNAAVPRPASRLENRLDSSRPPSRPSSRASIRPPSTVTILTPSHDGAQGRQTVHTDPSPVSSGPGPGLSSGSGKRKRSDSHASADALLRAPVVLKPHPSSLSVKPRMLHPLMLLPREYLPLSALDLFHPHGDFSSSRLYESNIKILNLEGRLGSNILLARSETNRAVYAVEREGDGLYILCKLGSWVDIESLGRSATVVCRERLRSAKPASSASIAELPLTTPSLYKESKRRKVAIEEIQSLVRKRSMSVLEKEPPVQHPAAPDERPATREGIAQTEAPAANQAEDGVETGAAANTGQETPAPVPAPCDDPLSQPDAEIIFQNIRAQYMEALYHSKGSLAYFAKGPLSRARAAFNMDWDSNLDMNDLVEFLKSLVMTTVLIDKKYRETVPEIVAKMKTLLQESENGASKPRKKKAKKPKLGKDGLYPGEIDHIKRWWSLHQPVSVVDDEKTFTATETRYHVSCLRRRETQLQMILILEILALEPIALAKGAECQLPGMESQAALRETSQEPLAKKRNKHNLPVLLDVHADRLCIWHSTTLDEVKAVAESQVPGQGREGEKPDRANSDPLKDFCVDIIVPFFSARLPAPCESLNRKLGGPVTQSSPKEKTVAKPASAIKPKPGAPIKRPAPPKRDKDRTLERALSVERSRRSVSRGPAATIALLRSASQTVIPGLKREASESTLIGLIPRPESSSNSIKDRPTGIFSRSVSLGGADLKAQKKAQVDAQLQDAISALKKPNRTLAVKDFNEAADQRASAGQLKKMKKPNRAAVTVKATPANNRYKDVLAAESASKSQHAPYLDIPPSSASVVPASTLPRKFANRLGNSASHRVVHATPARPSAGVVASVSSIPATGLRPTLPSLPEQQHQHQNHPREPDTPGGPGIPPSSPLMARKAAPPAAASFSFTVSASTTISTAIKPQPRYYNQQHLPLPSTRNHYASASPDADPYADDVPSSPPGLAALFETPLAPRTARERVGGGGVVVDDTPIRPRLPLGVAGDGANRGGGGRYGNLTGSVSGSGSGIGKGSENEVLFGLGGQVEKVKRGGGGSIGEGGVGETLNENRHKDGEGYGNGNGGGNGQSIYQRLGWDTTDLDDIDDLL